MAYVNIPINLSDRNYLYKPKPRYSSSEEERNSIGSPSPPRPGTMLPDVHLDPTWSVGNRIKFYERFQYPYFREYNSFPHFLGTEGDPTRLSSSMIPYNFECGPSNLPTLRTPTHTMVNGSPYGFHPHPYFHMKLPQTYQGINPLFYTSMRRPKRVRTAFNPHQLLTLENAFEKNHYVVGSERKQLAQTLGLSETQVKVWFQNRRTKHKRQKSDDENCCHKTKDKDCLECREDSCDESSSSDEETLSRNPSPEVSESSENPSKIGSKAIWNPIEEKIALPQSTMDERIEGS